MIEIFTDGFCWPNPGGALGVAAIIDGEAFSRGFAPAPHNTNNFAELGAIIHGLRQIKEPAKISVFTDSQFASRGINAWLSGCRDGAQPKLFELIAELAAPHEFDVQWVRGGSHDFHREADKAAREAALPFMQPRIAEAIRRYESSGSTEPLYKWMLRHARGAA